ncbi:MAG: DUF899 family protein [Pirellulales bacterium]
MNVYNLLDVCPKGRDEADFPGMSWVRHHDRYGVPGFVDPWAEADAGKANSAQANSEDRR